MYIAKDVGAESDILADFKQVRKETPTWREVACWLSWNLWGSFLLSQSSLNWAFAILILC